MRYRSHWHRPEEKQITGKLSTPSRISILDQNKLYRYVWYGLSERISAIIF